MPSKPSTRLFLSEADGNPPTGKTDFRELAKRSDADIRARRAGDVHFPEIDWASADVELVTPVQKKPISIRLDSDVLEFFQQDGKGYQGRINQVLRSFMEYEKKTG
ncbi:MAG: BrnA antitoxin family protein [Hyphomonas sp.]